MNSTPQRIWKPNWNAYPSAALKRTSIAACLIVFHLTSGILLAQTNKASLEVIVTSNKDGLPQPDGAITLREAILLQSGGLGSDQLSQAEKQMVRQSAHEERPSIKFRLLPNQSKIELISLLPPLTTPNLLLEGTTPSKPNPSAFQLPTVSLTPQTGKTIPYGLQIAASGITVRGLCIYGFAQSSDAPSSYASNILVAMPPNQTTADVLIEDNLLGMPIQTSNAASFRRSGFGIVVQRGDAVTIRRNTLAQNLGSAVLTGERARNLALIDNRIEGNGRGGMPDAIRLEGDVAEALLIRNRILSNAGSGIALFKSTGRVRIVENQLENNGSLHSRPAILLNGDNHLVQSNQIQHSAGAGIVMSNPVGMRNILNENSFAQMGGRLLEIVADENNDETNPQRNPQGLQLAAPRFLAKEFPLLPGEAGVVIEGVALVGSQVSLYLTNLNQTSGIPIVTTTTSSDGRFRFHLFKKELRQGDIVMAIATHPHYGSSEFSNVATIFAIPGLDYAPTRPKTPEVSPKPPIKVMPEPIKPIEADKPIKTTPTTPDPVRPKPPEAVAILPQPRKVKGQNILVRLPRLVYFVPDRADIRPAAGALLDQVVFQMSRYPGITVTIKGYGDAKMTTNSWQTLAKRRAYAVNAYLSRKGVEPERIVMAASTFNASKTKGIPPLNQCVEILYNAPNDLKIVVSTPTLSKPTPKNPRKKAKSGGHNFP